MSKHESVDSTEVRPMKSWQVIYDKEVTVDKRKRYISPSMKTFFEVDPIKILRSKGSYMYDEMDCEYLDCINNVAHVGHSHPKVSEACANQLSLLNTNNRFLHDNIVQLAERLTQTLPDKLQVCFFVNSGSEANDLALRLAYYYTKNRDVIVLDNAYHGHLSSLIPISPYKYLHNNCEDYRDDRVHVVANPDPYHGIYRNDAYPDQEELARLYSDKVKEVCHRIKEQNSGGIAAFFFESMQSCAGQIVFPPSYLRRVFDHIHEAGGVCIADEVQTGFGRVGKHMWAFQTYPDTVPDIVTMGKPMGNGYPVSAVITTKEIAEAFRRGPDYFNTFGGNPVSCAVALAVLDIIIEENLMENASIVGQFLIKSLTEMKNHYDIIGDVRGVGFFLGIDLVKDKKSRAPAVEEANNILWKLRRRGIIMSLDGPHDNVLKFKPPMCFSLNDATRLIKVLDEIFSQQKLNQ